MRRGWVWALLLVGAVAWAGKPSYGAARKLMDEGSWGEAVPEIEALLRESQSYDRMRELRAMLDESVWRDAAASLELRRVQAYLDRFTSGAHRREALALACELALADARIGDDATRSAALLAFAAEQRGCAEAQQAHEEGGGLALKLAREAGEARAMLAASAQFADLPGADELRELALERLFSDAALPGALDEALGLIAEFAGTPQARGALARLDEAHWALSKAAGTEAALAGYQAQFPTGAHAAEAEALRRTLLRGWFVEEGGRMVAATAWPAPGCRLYLFGDEVDSVRAEAVRVQGEQRWPARFAADEVAILRALRLPDDLLQPLVLPVRSAEGARWVEAPIAVEAGAQVLLSGPRSGEVVLPAAAGSGGALAAARRLVGSDPAAALAVIAALAPSAAPRVGGACRSSGLLVAWSGWEAQPGSRGAPFRRLGGGAEVCAGMPRPLWTERGKVGTLTPTAEWGGHWLGELALGSNVSAGAVVNQWMWAEHGGGVPIAPVKSGRVVQEAAAWRTGVASAPGEQVVELDGLSPPERLVVDGQRLRLSWWVDAGWREQEVAGRLVGMVGVGAPSPGALLWLDAVIADVHTLTVYRWSREGVVRVGSVGSGE